MINQTDVERYLDDWLGNTPMAPADRVVVAVAVRIGRERQRPAPRLAWAVGDLLGSGRLVATAAAVLVIAVAGFALLRTLSIDVASVPTPAPTAPVITQTFSPTPATAPTPSPETTPPPPLPQAALSGGLPRNWTVVAGEMLTFYVGGGGGSMDLELLPNRQVGAADCALGPEPGVGMGADDFVDALATRPGLVATNQESITVGALAGRQVDLRADASGDGRCAGEADDRFVPLFGRQEPLGWSFVGIADDGRTRLIVLDVPGDQNVVIHIAASDPQAFDRFIDGAMTIVQRLTFDFD